MPEVHEKNALIMTTVASTIEQFLVPNVKLLLSMGYRVDVIANFTNPGNISRERSVSFRQELEAMSVNVIDIPLPRNPVSGTVIKAYLKVRRQMRCKRYAIVHCHTPIAGAICRQAVKHSENRGKARVIYTAHGFHFYKGAPLVNWMLYYPVEKYMSRSTDILITINREDYRRAKEKFHAKKTLYMPGSGIECGKFTDIAVDRQAKRRSIGVSDDEIMLLSVGELNKNKNHTAVIHALGKMRNGRGDKGGYSPAGMIHYVIVGPGVLGRELKSIARAEGVKLTLLGYRRDVNELYACADIFALPSKREGLNVSLMEAIASGLPCIASSIRGNVELVDEEGGILVAKNDPDGWKEAIVNMCRADRAAMAEYNRGKGHQFEVGKIMEMTRTVYE